MQKSVRSQIAVLGHRVEEPSPTDTDKGQQESGEEAVSLIPACVENLTATSSCLWLAVEVAFKVLRIDRGTNEY